MNNRDMLLKDGKSFEVKLLLVLLMLQIIIVIIIIITIFYWVTILNLIFAFGKMSLTNKINNSYLLNIL